MVNYEFTSITRSTKRSFSFRKCRRQTDKTKKINEETKTPDTIPDHNEQEDNAELVAVITAAIATQTGKPANNLLVKKVVRSNNYKTGWENMKNDTNRY